MGGVARMLWGPLWVRERSLTSTGAGIAGHRSGGPRPDITAEPLDLTGLGRTRATRAVRFAEGLHVPKGKGARAP